MTYSAWFRCASGCDGVWPLTEIIYLCPRCQGLLEVEHDWAALAARDATAWKAVFDGRFRQAGSPYGGGVWGKKEWVAPHVDDDNVVSLLEGCSPLLRAERYGASLGLSNLWIKLCGNSHTGSFKDLGMTVLVSSVKQAVGSGANVRAMVCASTGDTSAALAAYGAVAGIPVVVLLPRGKVSAAQLVQPLAHGALVCSLDTDFDGCMRVVRALTEDRSVYLANSMNSLRIEGQKTVSVETAQQLGWQVPDWLLVPGGNLGNVSAIAKGFEMLKRLGLTSSVPRLVCCQAERANPLYRAYQRAQEQGRELRTDDVAPVTAGETLASAIRIGNPVSASKAIDALLATEGIVEQASEGELADAAARADRTGFFTCPHSAVALACLEKLVAQKVIGRGDTVVVVSTAHGLKFTEFKTGYHAGALEGGASQANVPVALGSEIEAVLPEISRRIDTANTQLGRT